MPRRHLVVGAGASYAECEAAGLPDALRLPLISNFARKMWSEYNPVRLLGSFLSEMGKLRDTDLADLRERFFELEKDPAAGVNIETFFEFAWIHREAFADEWENLMAHGILGPITFLLIQGLWRDGILDAPLKLSPSVARRLLPGDVILDLNYDTLFEIGAMQAGHELTFLPNKPSNNSILIAKPHGSINMVVGANGNSFRFGSLNWPGNPQPADGSRNFMGFIPPHQNKTYAGHWIAGEIFDAIPRTTPSIVTFWGIGFTKSDTGLSETYDVWCRPAQMIEVINPDDRVAEAVRHQYGPKVRHFSTAEQWLEA